MGFGKEKLEAICNEGLYERVIEAAINKFETYGINFALTRQTVEAAEAGLGTTPQESLYKSTYDKLGIAVNDRQCEAILTEPQSNEEASHKQIYTNWAQDLLRKQSSRKVERARDEVIREIQDKINETIVAISDCKNSGKAGEEQLRSLNNKLKNLNQFVESYLCRVLERSDRPRPTSKAEENFSHLCNNIKSLVDDISGEVTIIATTAAAPTQEANSAPTGSQKTRPHLTLGNR